MNLSLPRLFRPRPQSGQSSVRLWPRHDARPQGPDEQLLYEVLAQEGPLPRRVLVDKLADAMCAAERPSVYTAVLDIAVWGPAVSRVEAARVVRRSLGRLLIELD